MTWGIKFKREVGVWPMGCDSDGWLLDAMTGEPKRFESKAKAERYATLSYGREAWRLQGSRYTDFTAKKIGD